MPQAAVSSYITVSNSHIYSMGGPTGEIHEAPRGTPADDGFTGFGEKIQEMVYVAQDELAGWDKTNKALVGIHSAPWTWVIEAESSQCSATERTPSNSARTAEPTCRTCACDTRLSACRAHSDPRLQRQELHPRPPEAQ